MIIGATLSQTPYKVRTLQEEHYLRCGADILLTGLQQDLEGEAKCVVCGTTVHLKMRKGRVYDLKPDNAILHVVEIPIEEGKFRIECEATHLFDSEKCLRSWVGSYAGRPGGIFRPQEYLDRLSQGRKARVAFGRS